MIRCVKFRFIAMLSDDKKKISELIVAVRHGDDDACAELIRIYSPLLNGLVRYTMICLASSVEIDEDELRQEAAIKLYQAALTYDLDGEISFGLYAKICIRNRMRSLLRRHGVRAEHQTVELTDDLPDDGGDPSETVLRAEQDGELDVRIKKILSPLEYDVFNLYIDGVGPTEIAGALSISVKTAENAVYRMKNKIQKIL